MTSLHGKTLDVRIIVAPTVVFNPNTHLYITQKKEMIMEFGALKAFLQLKVLLTLSIIFKQILACKLC